MSVLTDFRETKKSRPLTAIFRFLAMTDAPSLAALAVVLLLLRESPDASRRARSTGYAALTPAAEPAGWGRLRFEFGVEGVSQTGLRGAIGQHGKERTGLVRADDEVAAVAVDRESDPLGQRVVFRVEPKRDVGGRVVCEVDPEDEHAVEWFPGGASLKRCRVADGVCSRQMALELRVPAIAFPLPIPRGVLLRCGITEARSRLKGCPGARAP
jgi:hypothetical protein